MEEENKQINNDSYIYQKNKLCNNEKILITNFLVFNTKIETHLDQLQGYLFWVGILEYFTWIILLSLFISSPSNMWIIWIFVYHNARATIGIFILKFLPKTHQVIEDLKIYDQNSLEEIQKLMEENYIKLIQEKEKILKPLMTTYFILTVISQIVDVIVFFVICTRFRNDMHFQKNFICLLGITAYISKNKF